MDSLRSQHTAPAHFGYLLLEDTEEELIDCLCGIHMNRMSNECWWTYKTTANVFTKVRSLYDQADEVLGTMFSEQ